LGVYQPNRQDKKKVNPKTYYILNTKYTNKQRLLKDEWEKWQITYKGKPIIVTVDFSTETLKEKSIWNDAFQAWEKITANVDYCNQQRCPS
jgi:hypothetical protein